MRKYLIYKILLILLFVSSYANAQSSDSIKAKNSELNKIKTDISKLEKELKNKSQKEKESLIAIENINRQNLLLSKLISSLISEEKEKQSDLDRIQNEILRIENKSAFLKEKYSRYVVWVYKNRGLSMLRFIFNAESFNEAFKRYQYLKYVSNENRKVLGSLNSNKEQLAVLLRELQSEKEGMERLVRQKIGEQERVSQKEKEKKEILQKLRNDKKAISQEIETKRRAEIVIKSIIAKLIELERDRKNKEREKKVTQKKFTQSFDYSTFQNFTELKGKLGWPVKTGKIIRKFGENKNEKLNTITLNYGIDIQLDSDKNVLNVAEGIVSAIDWIPGYGSIIIITHRDEHRTVYGHVANIAVREGQKVNAGQQLGIVNESLEGLILHFEIWNERNYQNPELWLSRK